MINNFIPRKARSLWDNVEKYGRVWQAADDNMAYALFMPNN